MTRFPLGSYIQVDNEIMRIASDSLSGTPVDKITVIRGALATSPEGHTQNAIIKKIKVPSIEFRRPSIIRASGHTFEYLGYGPGNYSTALPQVQDRTITEREEFLSQAQERGAGLVVYTGMNNKGDFYIGNQKKSSATGEETNFDIPVPTVTGEDPSRLSAVFDEVTIKERLVVEGGDSGQVLSQFGGPVTFDEKVKVNAQVKIANEIDSTGTTSGALVVTGGIGVGKSLSVGGDIIVTSNILPSSDSNSDIGSNSIRFSNVYADNYIGNYIGNGSKLVGISTLVDSNTNPRVSALAIGATVFGDLIVSGDVTAFFSSDERLKDNVTVIDDPLAKVLSLGGYTFDWNENTTKEGTETGVIAQEVEVLGLPGLVTTRDSGYKAVRYEKLVPLLIEAIKELSDKVEKLEQKLSDK
jgi:hypothetical protein